jgi:hypothetical protein
MNNLLKKLNDVNKFSTAANERYKVVHLEKVDTKFGRTIAAYITKGKEEELWRIYLPKKFIPSFEDAFVEQFNKQQAGDLF